MTNPRVVAREAQKRFMNRGAGILAAVFMIAFATVQFQANGARGLIDGKFLGLNLLVGFFAFRMGKWVAIGLYALMRAINAGRSKVSK
jgi:hypothetical protein